MRDEPDLAEAAVGLSATLDGHRLIQDFWLGIEEES